MMRHLKYLTLLAFLAIPLAACDDDDDVVAPPAEGTVRGTVTIDGQAAQGVTVELRGAATRSTTTNANGTYEFAAVAAGAYSVEISGFAADVSFGAVSRTAVINTAGQQVTVDFSGQFIRTSSIIATVEAGGSALANVSVALTGAGSATGQTNAQGIATFTGLRAGTYTVTISGFPASAQFAQTTQQVTVGVGQTGQASFVGNRPLTASVAISNITAITSGNPVNPGNIAGVISVNISVDAGDDTLQRLEALLDGEVFYTQTFSQAAAAEAAEEAEGAPFLVSAPLNTASFDADTGTPDYLNGQYELTVRLATVEGGNSAAVTSQTLTFNNNDVLVSNIASTRQANDAAGFLWRGGDVTVTYLPVLYSGNTVTTLSATFFGVNSTDNPAVFTRAAIGTVNSTVNPGTNLIANTVLSSGEQGPSNFRQVRYESVPPAILTDFSLTQQLGGGTVRCCGNNWVNPGYEWDDGAPTATDIVGGVAGVGGVGVTYHAGAAALTNAQLAALDAAPTPGAGGLAASEVNSTFSVVARVADALDNATLQRLQGLGINPLQTFGHDATPPTNQMVVAAGTTIANQTIFNANIGNPWTGVDQVQLSASEDFSGFSANPVALQHRALNAAGVGCSVGATAACTAVQVPFAITIPNTVPAGGVVTQAYYVYRGQVYNQAGLGSGTTTELWYLFDETAPNVNNIGIQGSYAAGGTYTFSATATDNVDLLDSQFALEFTGLTGSTLDVIPFGSLQTFGTPWTEDLTTTATATTTVSNFVVAIETTTAGSPDGAGSLVPVGWAQFAVRDVALNQSVQRNNFAGGSVEAGTSFDATEPFLSGGVFEAVVGAVDLCINAAEDCVAPNVRDVTLQAVISGPSGAVGNPFTNGVRFYYVDNLPASFSGGAGVGNHRFIGADTTADFSDDGTTRTVTYEVTLNGADLANAGWTTGDPLIVQVIGLNGTTGTALLGTASVGDITIFDNP